MPEVQIANPAGLYGLIGSWGTVEVQHVVNNSGATRKVGDVVVFSAPVNATTYWAPNVTTTTTVNDKTVIGVVGEPQDSGPDQAGGPGSGTGTAATSGTTYAAGAVMPIIVRGPARINIAANVVAANDILTTAAAAGTAATNAGVPAANAVTGSMIAIAAEASTAKDANNTIRCWVGKF